MDFSALKPDLQRNIALLKERSWFDIPIIYHNNRRAILAVEKGAPGEKAFADALAAWKMRNEGKEHSQDFQPSNE